MPQTKYCILLAIFVSTSVDAAGDTILHFGISSVAGYLAETTIHNQLNSESKRIVYGTALGTVPGLIKEIMDSNEKDNEFSGDDMLANVAGAFVGSLIANSVNHRLFAALQKKEEGYSVSLVYRY